MWDVHVAILWQTLIHQYIASISISYDVLNEPLLSIAWLTQEQTLTVDTMEQTQTNKQTLTLIGYTFVPLHILWKNMDTCKYWMFTETKYIIVWL